jgi:hypothetical protein
MNTLPMKYIFTRQMTAREAMPTQYASLNQAKSPSTSTRMFMLSQLEHCFIYMLTHTPVQLADLYVSGVQNHLSSTL